MRLLVVAAVLAVAVLLCSMVELVSAHGYVANPKSRQYECNLGTVTNCGPIMYEPQSVEAIKGLHSCSGNVATWAPLDDDSKAWIVNPVARGIVPFTWVQPAVHPPASWEYWIGNTQIALFTGTANTTHCVNLSGYSGYQKVLAIWNIADTPNAFYSCVDVNVGAGAAVACNGGGADVVTTIIVPPMPSSTARTTTPTTSTGGSTPTTPTTGCAATTYSIVSGDTLTNVAAAKGVTLAVLLAANPTITNPDLIYVGQIVNIPASAGCVATAVKRSSSTGTVRRSSSTATPIRYISSSTATRRRRAGDEAAGESAQDAIPGSDTASSDSGSDSASGDAVDITDDSQSGGSQAIVGSTGGNNGVTKSVNAAPSTAPPVLILSALFVLMGLLL